MGVGFVFYFLMLLWFTQAVGSKGHEARSVCTDKCGNVSIPYPFGMEDGCFTNSWFQVTCNKTVDGQSKPFLKRLNNLELLYSYSESIVLVNNPVIYFNCSHNKKEDNNNVVGAFTKILPHESPFFFSTSSNSFGSVGWGNLATLHINQIPVGGCLQPGCSGGRQYCYVRHIPQDNLDVLAANMTEMFPSAKGSNRCSSAFILDYHSMMDSDGVFSSTIGIETTHVPATLGWSLENIKCDLEDFSLLRESTSVITVKKEAAGILVPDVVAMLILSGPFGIETDCYMNEWFKVSCNEADKKTFLDKINMDLINTSLISSGEVIVNYPTYSSCHDEGNGSININLTRSPFFVSTSNIFGSVGCGRLITIYDHNIQADPIGGCLQSSNGSDGISGFLNNGCDIPIPPGLSSFAANMTKFYSSSSDNCINTSCSYAYMFHNWAWHNARLNRHNISSIKQIPSALQFATPKIGICDLHEGSTSTFSCSSDRRYCWTNLSSKHLCVCTYEEHTDTPYPFYYDNKYLTDVCREAGYCEDHEYKWCYMLCLNEPGKFCSSTSCPTGYEYDQTRNRCKPKKSSSNAWQIEIGIGTSIGTLLVLLAAWWIYKLLKRRNNIRRKQRNFKQNGGLLLQKQLSCNEGKIETIRFFTSKELEKATDHYNENRIVGQGAQGTVYKGMLADGRIVAIKKSKVDKDKKKQFLDEKQLEQWVNEVTILSQINHRNVVTLLGCCLETQFPMLVYEFIPNGTLSQMLNDKSEEFPLTWEMRLRIAIEAANAISYLHSAASAPIYHRDVKSTNILLDDKYRAKVSDFGISKSIGLEQTHLTTQVQGTFGYLDPEYFRSYQFTEKSDVYSFGVVLVELLTGQKPFTSMQRNEEVRSLVPIFLLSMKENSLFDILDPRVRNNGPPEEITAVARIARRCLNLDGKRRPTMKQVATELESIRAAAEDNYVQQISNVDDDFEYERTEPLANASCSTTSIILSKNSVTSPLLDGDTC